MEPVIYFVIMEDDMKIHQLLLTYFESFPNFECKGCFTTAGETRNYLMANPVHLLVADVQLPDMNGMDMIDSLPEKPLIIFMTGHNSKKTATRSYSVDAVHYLTKPFSFRDFKEALQRAVDRVAGKPSLDKSLGEHVFFGDGATLYRVLPSDIRFLEIAGNELTIHLAHGQQTKLRHTLKDALDLLPGTYFQQVHKSFAINLWHLRRLGSDSVTLYGTDRQIPVGRSHSVELRRRLSDDPDWKDS